MLIFSSVLYRYYRAVVMSSSSRHRPFCFHNFVFLLNCLFVLYNAHRISVCVIAVSKSHEFLLKIRRLFLHFLFDDDAYSLTSTRRIFFSTTSDTKYDLLIMLQWLTFLDLPVRRRRPIRWSKVSPAQYHWDSYGFM